MIHRSRLWIVLRSLRNKVQVVTEDDSIQTRSVFTLPELEIQSACAENGGGATPVEESNYITLLELFAKSVTDNEIHVIFVPVGETLQRFSHIAETVKTIAKNNAFFHVVETGNWFEGVKDYSSPEGHLCGEKGHHIVGRNLAKFIVDLAG